MKKMKYISVLLLSLFSAGSLLAGKIVSPWRATTAIVKAGETFEVWFDASGGQNVNSVELKSPYLTVSTSQSVASGTWQYDHESGNTYNRKITVTVPSSAPADRYDLILKTSNGNETSKASVKVIKEYKDMYYIVHMSDVHRWQSESRYPIDVTLQKAAAVIDVANIIGAEMLFETGDHHYNWESRPDKNAERVNIMFGGTTNWSGGDLHGSVEGVLGLHDATAATFLVPGNHDAPSKSYTSDPNKAVTLDWYNQEYGLAYYNFKYGNGRFMGANSGMGPVPSQQRSAASSWLNSAGHGNFKVGLGHAGGGAISGLDSSTNLDLILVGHNHFKASGNPHSVNGKNVQYIANSIRDTGTGNFECNIFRVNNNTGNFQVLGSAQSRVRLIDNHTKDNINNPSSWIPKLELKFDNANDGSDSTTRATLINRHNFSIPDAQVRFIMPKGSAYAISRGTFSQEPFDGDTVRVVDVSVDLDANSTTHVDISPNGDPVDPVDPEDPQDPTIPQVSFADSGSLILDEGDDLHLLINASDPDGIDRVYLYKNGVQLSRSEGGAPYDFGLSSQNDPELQNLQAGEYVFRAVAEDNVGDQGEATISVTVLAPGESPPLNINFQPGSAAVPAGYLTDTSQVFGSRGNGYSYGWTESFDKTRERNTDSDQRLDTLNHMQWSGAEYVWEIELPNGAYSVSITGGDPDFDNSIIDLVAEEGTANEVTLASGDTSGVYFVSGTQTVTVSDGRLTISNGSSAVNNKINYVEISALGDADNPVVSFASPPASIAAGENLHLTINASDASGVERVRLYRDGVELSRVEGLAPYEWGAPGQDDPELQNLEAGVYEFRAVAEDIYGNEGETTISVTVSGSGGASSIDINFQPASAPVPAGYLADTSQVFGDRGNGYSYGWDAAFDLTRDRNTHSDQRFDTLNHTQANGDHYWEIELPNGDYTVSIVGGDPNHDDSFVDFVAESGTVNEVTLASGDTAGVNFVTGSQTVTVSDGRLTVSNGSSAVNNKIGFINITPQTNGVPVVGFDSPPTIIPAGGNLHLTVNASDLNGIDRVYLYKDGVQLSRSEGEAPYEFGAPNQNDPELQNLQAGVYEFRAVAEDALGAGNEGEAIISVSVLDPVKINFQPSSAAVPSGYLADTSAVFGDRGNGYSYGWEAAFNLTRDRNSHADQRFDTLNHTQANDSDHYWEIELANGNYNVDITGGDPNYDDSYIEFIAEEGTANAVTLVSGNSAGANFTSGSATVTVSDGRLTISNGPNAVNNKISFVDISVSSVAASSSAGADRYASWKAEHTISDDMGDEDNDGFSNLLEFALGGDPHSAGGLQLPQVSMAGSMLEFKVTRQEGGVSYVVEKSTDLITWEPYRTVTDHDAYVGGEATVSVPTSEMNNGKLFLRLRVKK